MTKTTTRLIFCLLATAFVTAQLAGHAHAQSSLGIGTNDAMAPSTGLFSGFLTWVNLRQQQFYHALADAIKAMRQDGSKLWLLIGLSFVYGIFHAAGPGHGKAVISSYMLANEVALRRGILLSFISAFLQAITAIVVMLLAYFVLRGTSISMTDTAWFLEIASYAFVTVFGAWLLWRKLGPAVKRLFGAAPTYSLSAAHAHAGGHSHADHGHARAAHSHDHSAHDHHDHGHDHHDHAGHDHHHHHDHGLKHYHDEEMQSLSLRSDKPLDPSKFMPWLQNLVQIEGGKILRSKGILAFQDDDDRYVFQGVHMMLEGDHQRKWKPDEVRQSRVVFIGRELPEDAIREGFERCIVS